jgi:serine/threonine protein kinase
MMINNKLKLSLEKLDEYWLSMIFQVSRGLLFLNSINVLHNDAKPKNILYNKTKTETFNTYFINNVKYKINTNFIFKIADFGKIQIKGSVHNDMTVHMLDEKLKHRDDLRELSRIIFRFLVNYGKKIYSIDNLMDYIKKNNKYKIYYDEQKEEISRNLTNYPDKIKNDFLYRSLLYYGIENNILDKKRIIQKFSLTLPSDKVMNILDSLTNPKYKNIFSLFEMFII